MKMYQCPNCGRTYTEFQNVYYCGTCNYKLVNQEDIKKIKHPELSKREYHIIGRAEDPTKPIPKCPTCGSEKLSKVSTLSKAGSVFMFGLLSQKVKKTWHCDNCGYEW